MSLTISNIFFTGNLIGPVYSIARDGTPPSVTICSMWFLVQDFGLLLPIVILAWTNDPKVNLSYLTVSAAWWRWVASNGLNIWFWYRGLDIPNPAQCKEPRVWLFANLSAYGNVRTFFKIASTMSGVISVVWIFGGFTPSIINRGFRRVGRFEKRFAAGPELVLWGPLSDLLVEDEHEQETGQAGEGNESPAGPEGGSGENNREETENENERKRTLGEVLAKLGAGLLCISLLYTASIVGMELQIRWNNLTGLGNVSSVGQIIPLTIGCFSLSRALFLALVEGGVLDRGE
jgi:hypothetical protein